MSFIKEELQTSKINLTERRIVTTDFNLDDLNEGEIINLLQERKFSPSVINGLKKIEAALMGRPLRKVTQE